MISYEIPYGKKFLSLDLPDDALVNVILPRDTNKPANSNGFISKALSHPLGTFTWDSVKPGQTVCIAINDKTRPVPNSVMIPPLLERLKDLGIKDKNIYFLIATGTHTPMRKEEFSLLLPEEIIQRFKIISHDCDDREYLIALGNTTRKTPVFVNKLFFEAEIKILVGNIEPHHFMGYSGGVKTAAIGLTGRDTINANHAMLIEPESTFGTYETNPTRMDVEEIGDLLKIDGALNIVMNQKKEIVAALFGSPREIMNVGIPISRSICQTEVPQKNFDLVIASPGGYPKDINLYQAQKALSHAASITRDGGCVILIAECIEGIGSRAYEEFMDGISAVPDVFEKINKQGFSVGPHKALQFAREQRRITIFVVSTIGKNMIESLLLKFAETLNQAVVLSGDYLPKYPSIAIMPKATNTIPYVLKIS
jgi:nickel-dependent lactate racemase